MLEDLRKTTAVAHLQHDSNTITAPVSAALSRPDDYRFMTPTPATVTTPAPSLSMSPKQRDCATPAGPTVARLRKRPQLGCRRPLYWFAFYSPIAARASSTCWPLRPAHLITTSSADHVLNARSRAANNSAPPCADSDEHAGLAREFNPTGRSCCETLAAK
jgi:hypothetical protein